MDLGKGRKGAQMTRAFAPPCNGELLTCIIYRQSLEIPNIKSTGGRNTK